MTKQTVQIEKFQNFFGKARYRFYTVRKDGSANRSLRCWASRQGARDAARREGFSVAAR